MRICWAGGNMNTALRENVYVEPSNLFKEAGFWGAGLAKALGNLGSLYLCPIWKIYGKSYGKKKIGLRNFVKNSFSL